MKVGGFSGSRFSAGDRDTDWLTPEVLAHLPAGPVRVLEIGCGVGAVAVEIARRRSDLEVTGVDVSSVNIDEARQLAKASGLEKRVHFVVGAYPMDGIDPVDLAYANSVLYLIPESLDGLACALARDLRPGGLLVSAMPCDGLGNRVLIAARRVMALLRSEALETMALALAKRLYPDWEEAQLRDRIPYLYVIPVHLDSHAFRASLEKAGLSLTTRRMLPRSSVAKLRHSLSIYRRRS